MKLMRTQVPNFLVERVVKIRLVTIGLVFTNGHDLHVNESLQN